MILHFVWFGEHFYYPFYLGIISANKIINKDKTIVWAVNPPTDNQYWKLLDKIVDIRVIDKPALPHYNLYHDWERGVIISNYLRFDKLYEYGGIYIDTDTLTLRDFSYLLGDYEAVVSEHLGSGNWFLQNAIMMSKPKSELMRIARDNCISVLNKGWIERKTYRVRKYQGASSGPGAISYAYEHSDKSKVKVCETDLFFPFHWDNVKIFDEGLELTYYNLHVLHYYTAINKQKIVKITPDWVEKSNSLYARFVKSLLSEKEWRV